jgi:hypothetical protein
LNVSQARPGEQVSISTSFKNYQQFEQSYAIILQITDSEGFTAELDWSAGRLASGQVANVTNAWNTDEVGTYTVKMFVWDGVSQTPAPLSEVTTETFEVA